MTPITLQSQDGFLIRYKFGYTMRANYQTIVIYPDYILLTTPYGGTKVVSGFNLKQYDWIKSISFGETAYNTSNGWVLAN